MDKASWTITPFGGVGEIGSNMTVIKFECYQVIIDIGILFPYEDFFDINYLIPDFQNLDKELETHLVITHGHEDHIGAIHHLVSFMPNIKIYAPNFANELIHRKLQRYNLGHSVRVYDDHFKLEVGKLTIKPYRVNHSIPDTFGLIVHDSHNALIYISDFKVDPIAKHELPIDFDFLKTYLSQFKKRICLLDSTNILQDGKTPSEQDLVQGLRELISGKNRLFITLFSSNIHRMKNIIALAIEAKKKIVVSGRSIWHYAEAAKASGILDEEEFSQLLDYKETLPQNYIVLLTGCQGEHFGSMRRVAVGDHPVLKLNSNDTVAFSSKNIPGNEKKIGRIINSICEKGAEIVTAYDKKIHASGHPGKEDLKLIIEAINPTHYVPIHGEVFFLRKHIEFIQNLLPKCENFFMLNGDSLEVSSEVKVIKNEHLPPILIHGKSLEIQKEKIGERRKIACNGVVFVSISSHKTNVKVSTKGLPIDIDEQIDHLENLSKTIFSKNKKDSDKACEEVRIAIRNFLNGLLGYKPITIVNYV